MDDLCEISIKNVCCTCLSTERNLSQLCRIDDGVNNLFFLLSYKSEAYEAMFVKDVTQLSMCWECAATMQRLVRFREQACITQTTLTDIADGKINYSKIKCLSKLSYSRQTELTVTQEAGIKVETPENFVDCGPEIVNMKVETPSDSDEVPLAQLRDLKTEVAINNDEIDDDDDYLMSDEDTVDSPVLKKSNNDKTTVKNRDPAIPIIRYGNNVISSSLNMLEKLVDGFDIEKSKNIKRRHSLADISDDKETDHEIIVKSEIETSKSKRKLKSKNMEAFNVNIPISSGEKNDKFNEKQKLVDGNIVSFMTKKSQSEEIAVRNRYLEPPVSHKKAANDKSYVCFNIIQMTKEEMVKSIEMRKLEDDYVNALNKCESCIETFEDCDSLEKHISELHELKPNHVLCNICKVHVKDEYKKIHNKVHYTKYVCRICNESLQYRIFCKKNVKDHLKTKHLMQESYIDQQMKKLEELEYKLLYSKPRQEPEHCVKLQIVKSEIETSKSKRKLKSKNMEAYNVNIPISSGEKNDMLNEKQKLVDGNIVSFMTKTSQSEKIEVRNRYLEPAVPQKKAANDKSYECFNIIQMTKEEMVKSIEMRKLEDDYVNALNKCESCIETFEDSDSLEKHISELHELKPNHVLCNICKVYVKDEYIKIHNKVHYTKYVCRICNESLQYRIFCKKNVTDHLKTIHLMQESYIDQQMQKLEEQEDKLLYSKPRQEPEYGAKLKVLIDDPQGAGFACAECKKYFKSKNLRNKHIQKFHREGYQCPTCGKKFPFSATLRRHELTHCDNPPPREQCSVCGKMVRADLVKAHAKIHASGKQYACVACDKKFMTRSNYENHLKYARSHADREGLKYKCSVCGKDYRSPGELRDHYNFAHMGKTHHKCPICDKALATRRSVTKHVRRAHSGVKEKVRDHICQTCGKGFTHLHSLKEHELIHTGERPLTCDICARSFRQKACLYTHKRLVHKVALKKKPVHTDEIIVPNSEINKDSD